MKLLDAIGKNLSLYQEMTQARVPYDFLKKQEKEVLLQFCKKVNQMHMGEIIATLQSEAIVYLIKDSVFLSFLLKLNCEDKIDTDRLSLLLAHAEENSLLSDYKYEELYRVLTDEHIFSEWKYEYLRYYSQYGFDDEQKTVLMYGLEKMRNFTEISLSELSESERMLLVKPFFKAGRINNIISERTIWRYLEQTEVQEILQTFSTDWRISSGLNLKQMEEIGSNADAILRDLKIVISYLPDDCLELFFERWMESEALVYDLKQLKRNLPDAKNEEIIKMVKNRTSYLNFLYGNYLSEMNLEHLYDKKQDLLIYAITHRKKHFLSVVKENSSAFMRLSRFSLLLDKDVYTTYLNLNTLNGKNLQEAYDLRELPNEIKKHLIEKDYTFAELKLFASVGEQYVRLYHKLYALKYDERMKIVRELVRKECISQHISEESLDKITEKFLQKPLSQWIYGELGHVENLSWHCAIRILEEWEELERFIPGAKSEQHLLFLLKNRERLKAYPDFESVMKQVTEIDTTWKTLCQQLKIEPSFAEENQKGVRKFLYQGGAEIIGLFLQNSEGEKEKIRRLCLAEIADRFYDVKYHEGDLEHEIALEISKENEVAWRENLVTKNGNAKLWEEDRLLPVMQIGELVGHTCLSYRDGGYKECLLSAFDANKKVLYLSLNDQFVFRAFIRLTKGTLTKNKDVNRCLQFVDITKEKPAESPGQRNSKEQKEVLTLFLERPYFKGISDEKQKEVIQIVLRLLRRKAKKMSAQLVLSNDYEALVQKESGFIRTQYYMYISASKNGKQYLDSLGGMATVNNEGSYRRGTFLLPIEFFNQRAA